MTEVLAFESVRTQEWAACPGAYFRGAGDVEDTQAWVLLENLKQASRNRMMLSHEAVRPSPVAGHGGFTARQAESCPPNPDGCLGVPPTPAPIPASSRPVRVPLLGAESAGSGVTLLGHSLDSLPARCT